MNANRRPEARPSLVVYLPDLSGGGTERLYLGLAPAFVAAGFDVALLLDRRRGELLDRIPAGIAVHALDVPRQIRAIPRLAAFLRRARPDLLLAATEHMNVTAVLAAALARVRTRIVASQHNALSHQARRPGLKNAALPVLYRLALPRAAAVVAVSRGVADETASLSRLPRQAITVIHNGAIGPSFDADAAAPPPDWLPRGVPVIAAVGRLVPQKDHATLLRAFAGLADPTARLVLLGEGPLRAELEALAAGLGIADRVLFPGFVANPLPVMRAADLVVLSSRFEGFGLVLAEALACGTPALSTDCPYGPSEILEDGRHGRLVPVGDVAALTEAMAGALAAAPDRDALARRGRWFSIARCADEYVALFRQALDD